MSENPEELEPKSHGPLKPFLEHLEDLRWMLAKIAAAVSVSLVACFAFDPQILEFLQYPMRRSGIEQPSEFLKVFGPTDAFTLSFNLAMYSGLLLAAPVVIYLIVSYILPALTQKERRWVVPTLCLGGIFFLFGAAFCYWFVIPPTLTLSVQFTKWLNLSVGFWTVESYVGFVTRFMLSMGLAFEFPLVVLVLVWLGVLNYAKLAKARRYVIVLIFIVAAILTPTPDILSQIMLAAPLTLMFEACIWIAWFRDRKMKRESGQEDGRQGTEVGEE